VDAINISPVTDVWENFKKFENLTEYSQPKEQVMSPLTAKTWIDENGLNEAVTDFEEALLRTRPSSRLLSYEIPSSHKFHTFPRLKSTSLRDSINISDNLNDSNYLSNRGSSGTSSTTTTSTVIMKEITENSSTRDLMKVRNPFKLYAVTEFENLTIRLAT